jgi:uncharacterized membrane protein YdjX (TVP38/TMEM64 family)
MNTTDTEKPSRTWRILIWLRKRLVPLAGLLVALAIIIAVGWLYFKYPGFFENLKTYGYLGAFVISIILNATVIIPVSNMAIISSLGGVLPLPYVVGLAGGIGAAIGEMTGYIAGRSGRGLLSKSNVYNRVEGWVKKRGWIAVFILSIFPIVFDIVGIIAGALRMPIWRFFLAVWLGRTIIYIVAAYVGDRLFSLPWFG